MTHSFGFKVPPASFSLGNSQKPATCALRYILRYAGPFFMVRLYHFSYPCFWFDVVS